jgi:hypothetical protein
MRSEPHRNLLPDRWAGVSIDEYGTLALQADTLNQG